MINLNTFEMWSELNSDFQTIVFSTYIKLYAYADLPTLPELFGSLPHSGVHSRSPALSINIHA